MSSERRPDESLLFDWKLVFLLVAADLPRFSLDDFLELELVFRPISKVLSSYSSRVSSESL